LNTILKNAFETTRNQLQFIEGKSHYLTTLKIVSGLKDIYKEKFSKGLEFEGETVKFIKFILGNFHSNVHDWESMFYYNRILDQFSDYPNFILKSRNIKYR